MYLQVSECLRIFRNINRIVGILYFLICGDQAQAHCQCTVDFVHFTRLSDSGFDDISVLIVALKLFGFEYR